MMKYYSLVFILFISFTALAVTEKQDDYRIQIGDMIQISLPGEVALQEPFNVDRLGRVILPEIGALKVSGLTLSEAAVYVKSALKSVYIGLDNLSVYLHKKQILVTVEGYVLNPGEYLLREDASVQIALHAAGGLRKGAQLDRVKITRANKNQHFNYKKYLDTGDSEHLPMLQSMDAIFIPASPMTGNVEVEFDPSKIADGGDAANYQKAIKVFGEVNSPGSFSYRESLSIVDLLMRAGGVTRYAGVEKIRVISQGNPKIFNLKLYLDSGDEHYLPTIMEGATIFIPKQEEEIKSGAQMVYIMGEVAKPGAYESKQGVTFMDILANAGGPTRFAESRQIRVIKADGSVLRFDLAGYTEGTNEQMPPDVFAGDAIFVPEKVDMNEKSWLKVAPERAVRVLGAVVRPGRIEWSQEMSLLDLIAHVGGPTSKADTNNIEIVIPDLSGKTTTNVFDLNAFIKSGLSDKDLPQINAGSTVLVHELPVDPKDNKAQWVRQSAEKSIYIFGQVGAPGRYMFTDEMAFLDILSAADGPTEDADLRNLRINHRDDIMKGVSKLDLALYFETGDDTLIPKVRAGDTIYIPEKNRIWLDHSKESTVRVLGAVNKAGRYRFDDSMTVLDVLAQAGGASSDAYIEKITVVNLSCCKDQARTFNLSKFSRTGAFNELPVLRAGDTIFIPNKDESIYEKFREGLTTVLQTAALAVLLGVL